MMKATLLATLSLTMFVSFGCGEDDNDDSPQQNQEQLSSSEARIRDIKVSLRQITARATEVYDRDDNKPEILVETHPLVNELETLNAPRTAIEKQETMIGAWRQIWSNFAMGKEGQGPLADHVYQVILPGDVLWNIALVQYGGLRRTELLRAHYTVTDGEFSFTYTKALFIPQWVPYGTDLVALATRAETGAFDVNQIVYEIGMNPLGQRASLSHSFLDADFRVHRGGSLEVGMEHSFLFEKVATIEAAK